MPPITYGLPRHSLRAADLTITETRHSAGFRLRPHEHEVANVYIPLQGRLRETIERSSFDGQPGTVLVKPGGARHSNEYGDHDVVGIVIEVPQPAQERLGLEALFGDRRRLVDAECARLAARLARALRSQGPGRTLLVEGLAYELFGVLSRSPRPSQRKPPWLENVRSRIMAQPETGDSLESVADTVGRHPSHVAREFRRHYGTTVGEYARQRRIEQAAAELRVSRRPIAEIALRAGFYDQSHFTNTFRRAFGITPAEYRRCAQETSKSASDIQDD
jgi:AraC family transcriptional regulator